MKKAFLLVCFCWLTSQVFANDALFKQVLEMTNLTHFSENLLLSEQRNLEQFSKEILLFTCLSDKGKQIALQEIQTLQTQTKQHSASLQKNIQTITTKHLRNMLTEKHMRNILVFMETADGKRLTESLKKNHTDIINTPSILYQDNLLPKNSNKKAKQQEALKILRLIASEDTKKAIFADIGKENYGKEIEKGIKALQKIFIEEGCVIE